MYLKISQKVVIYLDDILILGADSTEHLQLLGQVFVRLDKAGRRPKKKNKKQMWIPCVLSYLITWAIR